MEPDVKRISKGSFETNDYQVVVVDNLSTGRREKLPASHPNLKFIKIQTTDER